MPKSRAPSNPQREQRHAKPPAADQQPRWRHRALLMPLLVLAAAAAAAALLGSRVLAGPGARNLDAGCAADGPLVALRGWLDAHGAWLSPKLALHCAGAAGRDVRVARGAAGGRDARPDGARE